MLHSARVSTPTLSYAWHLRTNEHRREPRGFCDGFAWHIHDLRRVGTQRLCPRQTDFSGRTTSSLYGTHFADRGRILRQDVTRCPSAHDARPPVMREHWDPQTLLHRRTEHTYDATATADTSCAPSTHRPHLRTWQGYELMLGSLSSVRGETSAFGLHVSKL